MFSRYSGYDFICVELNIDEGNLIPIIPNKEFVNKKKEEINQKKDLKLPKRYSIIDIRNEVLYNQVLNNYNKSYNNNFKKSYNVI